MTNKKTLITLLVLLTFVVGNVMAQGRKGKGKWKKKSAEERATLLTKRMTGPLKLTADQQTKAKAIHLTAENQMTTLRADKKAGKLTKEDAKAKRKEINKTRRQGIKGLLDDQQKKRYKKWRKNRNRKGRRKGKGKKGKVGNDNDNDNDSDDDNGGK
ncbi:hypothetical protein [Microscilla marina]|uniref:Uncharacterized protein n=1 Tax=Microscilla marina ATCC 23134 TaxID=313606 RepID=A1ZEZ3_MICM2|nr:hypothetical protein [Microscilla marina]EAY31095.1 hypothetical protein M23134_07503 [Microscilla marina ATCC 23134]